MRRLFWVLVFTVLLVGCSSRPPVSDEPAPADTVSPPAESPAQEQVMADTLAKSFDPAEQPVVTLLAAGETPRRELRYGFRPGYLDTVIFDMSISMKTTMGGMSLMDMRMPTSRMWVALEAVEVARDGSCRYQADYFDVEVLEDGNTDPNVSQVYAAEMEKLVGMKTRGVITDRGFQPEMETEMPPGIDPETQQSLDQMEQSMENMAAPFPAEAVGVGARWSVFMPVDVNNLVGSQTATYELVEFTDDGVKLAMDMVQDFPPQPLVSEDLPEGVTMELTSCDSSAEGFMAVTFSRLVPRAGLMMDMVMHTAMEGMGMTQNMQMDMKMDMSTYGLDTLK